MRELLAQTAYRTGDFALARRELHTARRLSGSNRNLALLIETERALGRPERAIAEGREADRSSLRTEEQVYVAIALSGARLDLGQTQQALFELESVPLEPNRAFSWSGELFAAYAAVLEELGRTQEAATWARRAEAADAALAHDAAGFDELEVFEIYEQDEIQGDDAREGTEAASAAAPSEQDDS